MESRKQLILHETGSLHMTILLLLTSATLANAQSTPIDISGSQFAIHSADTIRLRNVTVTGYQGKYFADIQWNAGHSSRCRPCINDTRVTGRSTVSAISVQTPDRPVRAIPPVRSMPT
jgi:hypothetical protein